MKPTLFIVTIISSIFAIMGYINGLIMEYNYKNPGFESLTQKRENIIESNKPFYYELNNYYKSNSFRIQPLRVVLFNDYTIVEMYAENFSQNKTTVSREFFSFTENRDEGFYILIGDKQYKSTSINNGYSYVIKRLPLREKRLLIIKFEPIPRDSKKITIRTATSGSGSKANQINILAELDKPHYLEANYTDNHNKRDAFYKMNSEASYETNFNYDYKEKEVKINIHTVSIGYDYTYVDFDLTNYAERMTYQLNINNGFTGRLSLSVPNAVSRDIISQYVYNGKTSEQGAGNIKVKPNSTINVRLVFNTIPNNTRRIELKNFLYRDSSFSIQLK